ncbi:MAG: hypothetical protein V4727_09270 [Verrucomicrobiota bacterium]
MNITIITNGVNEDAALLYRIIIAGEFYYVGCANKASRPLKHYLRHVERQKIGVPYRKNNPDGFREIHRRLFEAYKNSESVIIELIRNVTPDQKFREEGIEIQKHLDIHGSRLLNATMNPIKKWGSFQMAPAVGIEPTT